MDSDQVLLHLNSCYKSQQPIDNDLIDRFNTSVTKSSLNLTQLIGIINQILINSDLTLVDPEGILINLLEKLLSMLSFEEILLVYPLNTIYQFLIESDNSTVKQLCLNVINLNLHEEKTQEFLYVNDILSKLIRIYFTRDTPIPVLNQIEKLTNSLTSSEFNKLITSELLSFIQSFRINEDTTLMARYLDYLLIILPHIQHNPSLYQFTKSEIVQIDDDPLYLILLAQFYLKLLDQLCDISTSLNALISLYVNDQLNELVKGEVINIISKMSYLNKYIPILEQNQIFKTHNLIKIFEHNQSDIQLLTKVNSDIILQLNPEIYQDILSNLSLFNDQLYQPVLLNFIKSREIFNKLSDQFTNYKFSIMSRDRLYNVLLRMSQFKHTKEYLFNNLPNIITKYLIEPESIQNNQLWKLKLEILENLLQEDDVLGYEYWFDELDQVYEVMKYGKCFKNAQVDIMDETV
ncbi:DNA mismatch repair protein HSM3 [Spathaspora sp. JA1]|nr:DNA mismatch repair protein HSM3 [Spathaspora sp. JA1]